MSAAATIAILAAAMTSLGTLVVVLGLLRRVLPVLERAERILAADPLSPDSGLEIGSTVPDFTVITRNGRQVTFHELHAGPSVYLFIDEGCPSCNRLVGDLQTDGWTGPEPLILIADAAPDWARGIPGKCTATHQERNSASEAFRQTTLPQAFAVNADRVVTARISPTSLSDLSHIALASHRREFALTPESQDTNPRTLKP